MPALKQCIECEGLHSRKGARCATCSSGEQRQRDAARGNRHQRGLGYEHEKARAQVLADNPMCHWCGVRVATTADHVQQRVDGGQSTPDNEVPSCAPCNYGRQGKTPTPPQV